MTPRDPTDHIRRKKIEQREAYGQGRRFVVFYRGYHARRKSQDTNPYPADTPDHAAWQAGWDYAGPADGPHSIDGETHAIYKDSSND